MKYLVPGFSQLLLLLLTPLAFAADNVRDHPGFVDFDEISSIAGSEPIIEVSLKAPLLKMISNIVQREDEEAGDFLSRLLRVNVHLFTSEKINSAKLLATMSETSRELDRKGWDRVVRMREENDNIDIYFKLSDDAELIHGITIMAIHKEESTVFVNIVGDISPDDISNLGDQFDLDELKDLNYSGSRSESDK